MPIIICCFILLDTAEYCLPFVAYGIWFVLTLLFLTIVDIKSGQPTM